MVIKYLRTFLLYILAICLLYGCECEPDEFGEELTIDIPINIGGRSNIFQVGDTLWLDSRFNKYVNVENSPNDIELQNFDFFSSLFISDISGENLVRYQTGNILIELGDVSLSPSGGYDYFFTETEEEYNIRFGVVLNSVGHFTATSFTDSNRQRGYDHPALYTCKNNRRMNVFINRINRFSTPENFEDLMAWNRVDIEGFTQTYEGYRRSAMFAFAVVE